MYIEVMGSREERAKYSPWRSRYRTGIMPLFHIFLARASHKIDSRSQITRVRKKRLHISIGGDAKLHCKGPGYAARTPGIIADIFANNLSHSHYNVESLKPHCEGGVINPISQMRKLRPREFRLLFPLFLPRTLGTDGTGMWLLPRYGQLCTGEAKDT